MMARDGVNARPTIPGPERYCSGWFCPSNRMIPLLPCKRGRHVKPPLRVERQPLRPAEAAEVRVYFTCLRNSVD